MIILILYCYKFLPAIRQYSKNSRSKNIRVDFLLCFFFVFVQFLYFFSRECFHCELIWFFYVCPIFTHIYISLKEKQSLIKEWFPLSPPPLPFLSFRLHSSFFVIEQSVYEHSTVNQNKVHGYCNCFAWLLFFFWIGICYIYRIFFCYETLFVHSGCMRMYLVKKKIKKALVFVFK